MCRLFKKADDQRQDDNDEGSNFDEIETISSPNLTVCQEETRLQTAGIHASAGSNLQTAQKCVVKSSNSETSETVFPDHSCINTNDLHLLESKPNKEIHEVDSHLKGATKDIDHSLDPNSQGLQVENKTGILYMEPLFIPETDDPLCEATGKGNPFLVSDMSKNTSVEGGRLYSRADAQVAPVQIHSFADDDDIFSDAALDRFCNLPSLEEHIYSNKANHAIHSNHMMDEYGNQRVGPKIKTTSETRESPSNFVKQGTAHRRIRLQLTLEAQEKPSNNAAVSALGVSDRKSSTSADQTSTSSFLQQLTAQRRIRLKKRSLFKSSNSKNDESKTRVAESRSVPEEVRQKISPDDEHGEKACSQKTPISYVLGSWPVSAVYMIKAVLAILLFMAFIGLWKAWNWSVFSS